MGLKLPSLSYVGGHARDAFFRFPYVLLSALLAAGISIALVETGSSDPGMVRLFMTCALGIPLFFSLALYLEKPLPSFRPSRPPALAAGFLFLCGFYFLSGGELTKGFFLHYAQWALVLHLSVSFAPFLSPGEVNGFWQFNRRLFLRACLSVLYACVFYLGLALALWALDFLLGVKVHGRLYEDLWIVSVFVLQTWHFAAGVPGNLEELDRVEDYPGGLKVFTQYLLVPLVALYGTILYLYMAKILVRGDWPKGIVTWLVSSLSVFGVLTLLLLNPILERRENRWIKAYAGGFYLALIPLLGMLFTAAGKRVRQYGVTEERYFVLVLALWILGIAAYFLLSRGKNIKWVPLTLCLTALATSLGPWGAYDVSKASQRARLKALLAKDGLWDGARARKAVRPVDFQDEKEISSILDYLIGDHGVESVRDLFAVDLSKFGKDGGRGRQGASLASAEICRSLGLAHVDPWQSVSSSDYFNFGCGNGGLLPLSGYEYAVEVSYWNGLKLKAGGRDLAGRTEGGMLELAEAGRPLLRFDIEKLVKGLEAATGSESKYNLDPGQMAVESQGAGARGKFFLRNLSGYRKKGGFQVGSTSGLLLFSLGPAPSRSRKQPLP